MSSSEFILIDEDLNLAVEAAANIFRSNGVFVYPTDTIYGLGANPFSSDAVDRVKSIKGRGEEQKFILLADTIETVSAYTNIDDGKIALLRNIWPGPVSVILSVRNEFRNQLGNNIAFRIPDYIFCLELLRKLKQPVVSTSVNKTGEPPLNDPVLIRNEFGNVLDAILYTNQNMKSAASTLIDFTGSSPILIREGNFKFSEILKFI